MKTQEQLSAMEKDDKKGDRLKEEGNGAPAQVAFEDEAQSRAAATGDLKPSAATVIAATVVAPKLDSRAERGSDDIENPGLVLAPHVAAPDKKTDGHQMREETRSSCTPPGGRRRSRNGRGRGTGRGGRRQRQ